MRLEKDQEKELFEVVRKELLTSSPILSTQDWMYHRNFLDCHYTEIELTKFKINFYRKVDIFKTSIVLKNSMWGCEITFSPLNTIRIWILTRKYFKDYNKRIALASKPSKT